MQACQHPSASKANHKQATELFPADLTDLFLFEWFVSALRSLDIEQDCSLWFLQTLSYPCLPHWSFGYLGSWLTLKIQINGIGNKSGRGQWTLRLGALAPPVVKGWPSLWGPAYFRVQCWQLSPVHARRSVLTLLAPSPSISNHNNIENKYNTDILA